MKRVPTNLTNKCSENVAVAIKTKGKTKKIYIFKFSRQILSRVTIQVK